jgi:iron complex outermembrane receptor protein
MPLVRALTFLSLTAALPPQAQAQTAPSRPTSDDGEQALADLSIEQLAQIPVRSASKRLEPLSDVPAALFVITGEEATDSGASSLPEALRLAPNLNVQQVDASQYSISARGFNGPQASNKLLALVDGRSIYTPLAASVFWELHLPILEDVRQIEVISGPGGTLYGPNAVNGVLNLITRDAQDTLGTLARGTLGSQERSVALRHGLALGNNGAVRVYGQWLQRDGLPSPRPTVKDDEFRGWKTGLRSDFVTDRDHLTIQGDGHGPSARRVRSNCRLITTGSVAISRMSTIRFRRWTLKRRSISPAVPIAWWQVAAFERLGTSSSIA